jgi:ParB-like chromosome segregation protein Spo0J
MSTQSQAVSSAGVQCGEERVYALNKLKKSPRNVRKVPHTEAEIEARAASIKTKGVLQPPVVEPELRADGAETGYAFVTAGEGRRLALRLLAKRKVISKTTPIRCLVDTVNDPQEISLDENVSRSALHPADEYEAFRDQAERRGFGAEEIGARFGVSAAVVRQRLRLGAVAPDLLDVYRAGDLTLDQLMAFAISEDHARQRQVFGTLTNRQPYAIRRALTETQVQADDRRVAFVGVPAYLAAGGEVIRDLFTDDAGGYLDVALLDRLTAEKLADMADDLRDAEGWKWSAAYLDYPHGHGLSRVYPRPVERGEADAARLSALRDEYAELSEQWGAVEDLPAEVEARLSGIEEALAAQPDHAYDPAQVAYAGVMEGALERRNHWEKTSHSLLVGVILHVLYAETDKTLAGVANFLADPQRTIEATLRAMMTTRHLADRVHPVVASAARELLNKSDNERSGVLSTAMSFLGLYRDPVVAQVTSRCDWRIADLVEADRPVSLYLVVPPSDISRTKPLIRLILNQIGRRLTEGLEASRSRRRLLLMLDEFRALGRLEFFEQALAFMAGYRIKAFLIVQSLNQIEAAYGANNAILDNCHVRVAFSTNDERTARRISDSLGTATELRAMKNYAGHRLAPWLGHLMVSRQETARPLLTPGEVMQLPPDEEVVQVSGVPPIRARKVRYYLDRRLAERVESPPAIRTRFAPADAGNDWIEVAAAEVGANASPVTPVDEGGHRIEPELGGMDPAPARPSEPQMNLDLDGEGDEVQQAAEVQRRFKTVARQAALDPDDGIAL